MRSWWLNPGAACRDGIIDSPFEPITTDGNLAYAIVLNRLEGPADKKIVFTDESGKFTYRYAETQQERESFWPTWISFFFSTKRPGVYQLLRCILYGGSPIRVLRTHLSPKRLTPRAGVRYDGLYRIRGYSKSGSSMYNFTLERVEENQVPWSEVERHPISEEMDDWMEYVTTQVEDDEEDVANLLTSELSSVSLQPETPSPESQNIESPIDYFSPKQGDSRATFSLGVEPDLEDD